MRALTQACHKMSMSVIKRVMKTLLPVSIGFAIAVAAPLQAQRNGRIPPDLQGVWTNGTVTTLERPPDFADKSHFTLEEAAEFERTFPERVLKRFGAAAVLQTDFTDVYLDRNEMKVLPDRRTSLIIDPPDGRLPPALPAAAARAAARPAGNAHPEEFPLGERCLVHTQLGASTASPPLIPIFFGGMNYFQIVQTDDSVVIVSELVHDARIVRMNGQHAPASIRRWLGDSVGRWEGSTLVVDTTNFRAETRNQGSGERLHVVERFTKVDARTINYRVTVDDPDTWARSWTAEMPFRNANARMLEYACHEANYSLGGSLRGARAEEQRQKEETK